MTYTEKQDHTERITFLWHRADAHRPGTEANRIALGEIFRELQSLYSDRTKADIRLTSGHGTFEDEIRKRGYSPRTVRGWISDRNAASDGQPSESAKRKARRHARLASDALDSITEFARLLPFKAAQRAYYEAAKILHPDNGGSTRKMQLLNQAWERSKPHYQSASD